jgi:periodic tryptophan protein 1
MEHYDDEDDQQGFAGEPLSMLGNVKSLAYHESNADDPYITKVREHDDVDEERQELEILPTDNLILAGRVEDEVAHLEVYVYEDEADNLYVHHDIMLPSIPLAVEWVSLPDPDARFGKLRESGNPGINVAAVGMMEPDIVLWDLDTIDCMYPQGILGPTGFNKDRKKKKRVRKEYPHNDYHVNAVLSLASNRQHRNLLLSGSADTTVKLWDLTNLACAHSYNYHSDKVSSVAWSPGPSSSSCFLSGSYDQDVVLANAVSPDTSPPRWRFQHDVEQVVWDSHNPNCFFVNTEDGMVHYFDWRGHHSDPTKAKPLWQLQAHDESISAFDVNPIIPGFLATGSNDKTVKLWNVGPQGPTMVVKRDLGVGKVFSTQFAPDPEVGFRLAVSGSKGSVQIWDTSTNAAARRIFGDKVAPNGHLETVKERTVGVEESDDDSDDDDEGEEEPGDAMEE